MTDPTEAAAATSRRLVCAGCGTEFGCDLSGECWCMEEPVTLPMPTSGDCLCPACLRKAAGTDRSPHARSGMPALRDR